jgi:hypothetical protein
VGLELEQLEQEQQEQEQLELVELGQRALVEHPLVERPLAERPLGHPYQTWGTRLGGHHRRRHRRLVDVVPWVPLVELVPLSLVVEGP